MRALLGIGRTRTPGTSVPVWDALHTWWGSPLGLRLLGSGRRELEAILPNVFGYHLVQVGRVPQELVASSRIPHKVTLDLAPLPESARADERRVFGSPEALPLSSDSVDLLLLPHVLEFSAAPHLVLREAERVLIPEGHLVVLGLNPWSLWSIWRWALAWRGAVPWQGGFYSAVRVKDWLALLGFDIVLTRHYFFAPPMQHEGIMNRFGLAEAVGRRCWPMLGAAYVLVARKRVTTLTPIRPRWRARRRFAPAELPSPE